MKNGGPAFACAAENGHQEGMTLWDYFFGQAIVGLQADHNVTDNLARTMKKFGDKNTEDTLAKMAAEIADAMIAEREKRFNK